MAYCRSDRMLAQPLATLHPVADKKREPMATGTTAYLVVRRDDGFGDVFPLDPAQSYSLGRAATNTIVLKDDLCSRDHAEVSFSAGHWRVRDLNSLNGTRVNDTRLEGE